MEIPSMQQSFKGFEQYAEQSESTDVAATIVDVLSKPRIFSLCQAVDTRLWKDNEDKTGTDTPLDVKISNNIQKISKLVTELKDLVENIGTSFDSRDLRDKLKGKQESTNTLSKVTTVLFKDFSQACPTDHKKQREWKLQQSRFNDMFQDVLKQYNELQKVIRTKERITLRESLASSGHQSVHIDDGGCFVDESGKQIQLEDIQEEADLEQIKKRQDELKALEQDIVDINTIFKDLAVMVHDQGEQVDEIEKNVEEAVIDVEKGKNDLAVAAEYTTASRKKTLCIVLVVVIVIAVVVTIILLATLA